MPAMMASNFKAQRGNQRIEVLRGKFAFGLHLFTQRFGQIDIKP